MKTGVIVTSRNDVGLLETLESLDRQSSPADAIAVADGSDTEWLESFDLQQASSKFGARWRHHPGASVPKARNMGLDALRDMDIVAFLDTDEYAPEPWLDTLTRPIENGMADFTGGPTKPHGEGTEYSTYLGTIEDRHYELVAHDISALPMGNSAWRLEVFDSIGGFDESFTLSGEDYDVNLRALSQGYKGHYVPDAWVYHDQSRLNTSWKILRRKYRYMVGGAMAYQKNKATLEKIRRLSRQPRYWHWLEFFNPPLRLLAFFHALNIQGGRVG